MNKITTYNNIIDGINIGLPVLKIGKKYNIPLSTIYNIKRKYNLKIISSAQYNNDLILQYYHNGLTIREIEKCIDISYNTIHKILQNNKLPLIKKKITRNAPNIRNDVNTPELISDYNNKMSISELREKYNCSNNVIYKRLKDNNIIPEGVGLGIDDCAIKLYLSGKSTCYIADKYNCDTTTVSNILEKNNIPRNNIYVESAIETKIKELLLKNNIKFIQNDKTILNKKELDFYLPDHNIAIELNGLYWHSEKYRHKKYHYEKYIQCKNKNIQLLQFWEDDIRDKLNIIEKMIISKCGLNSDKAYARKCQIIDITSSIANKFHTEYHIQGSSKYSISKALVHDGNIVGVMSFKKRNENTLELVRYSTNIHVVGGASKLLNVVKNYTIVTFSDNCISNGNMYNVLGFIITKHLLPDYKYLIGGKLKHKFNYRKLRYKNDSKLKYQSNLTETQLAKLNNILKVYDSGKIKWELKQKFHSPS